MHRVIPGATVMVHSLVIDTRYNETTGRVLAILTTGGSQQKVFVRVGDETIACSKHNLRAANTSRTRLTGTTRTRAAIGVCALLCALLWHWEYLYESHRTRM